MKRRTEINIELTRSLHIRRHAAPCACALCAAQAFAPRWTTIHCRPCACALCAAQGELDAPDEAAVLIEVSTRTVADSSAADQGYFVENADAGEAIEIESAEGQLILAAAVRSLEQRLSPEARAALAVPPAPTVARRSRFSRRLYAKLGWFRQLIIHPTSTRRTQKEK